MAGVIDGATDSFSALLHGKGERSVRVRSMLLQADATVIAEMQSTASTRVVTCHGDFNPTNVLRVGGTTTEGASNRGVQLQLVDFDMANVNCAVQVSGLRV
jgi:thiamine kinase-like enzyme